MNEVLSANSYICATGEGDDCFLVDPGSDAVRIEQVLVRERLTPRHIFLTHGHFDHSGSASHFQQMYGINVRMHAADLKILKASNFLTMAFKIPFKMQIPSVDACDALRLTIGGRMLRFVPTPGHTPGSCVIQWGDVVFTGDTLYSDGIGLSRLPGEDAVQLRASLHGLWETMLPESTVYPGHGRPALFSHIREHNVALLAFLGEVPIPSLGV